MAESESGAEPTAVQMLARWSGALRFAKRLDCGAFTAVFERSEMTAIPGIKHSG